MTTVTKAPQCLQSPRSQGHSQRVRMSVCFCAYLSVWMRRLWHISTHSLRTSEKLVRPSDLRFEKQIWTQKMLWKVYSAFKAKENEKKINKKSSKIFYYLNMPYSTSVVLHMSHLTVSCGIFSFVTTSSSWPCVSLIYNEVFPFDKWLMLCYVRRWKFWILQHQLFSHWQWHTS